MWKGSEPLLALGAGCSLTYGLFLVPPRRVPHAPQCMASLYPHDIPRGPWTLQSASIVLWGLTAPKREQRAWPSQELKDASPLGCDSVYAPCSLLG